MTLWDALPEAAARAADRIEATLDGMASAGAVRVAASLGEALEGAGHVQESVSERAEIKRPLFAEIDLLAAREAVVASSTSAIPASALFEPLPTRARCLIAHPVNPPHLIPLVEISGAPFTDPAVVARTARLMRDVGQSPVVLRQEVPGFLLNRLQWALLGEALHLVGEGYCDAADVDAVVTEGLARRWALLGPFGVGHLNADAGIGGYFATLADAMTRVRESLRADYPPSAELIERLHSEMTAIHGDDIGVLQQERDRRIAALRGYLET